MDKKEVENCTIFLTIAGSKAYGTDNPESDTDVRGVCIPKDKSYYIGMGINRFEQKDGGWEDDRVVYDLRKTINLMSDGNPNMVDLLFTDERHWLKRDKEWETVCEYRDLFLSKKMRYTYGGYAFAQLKRIQRHRGYLLNPPKKKPERSDFGLPAEKILKPDDIGAFQWLIAKALQDSVQLMNFKQETRHDLEEYLNPVGLIQSKMSTDMTLQEWEVIKKVTSASDEFITTMMKEKAYANAMSNWVAYENWNKERNDKRRILEAKYGYDTKHAMHLVRLMRMGIEILETQTVNVYRPDREELNAIRHGAWHYEQVVEYANNCEKKMDELTKTTKLPANPNRKFLDQVCQNIIENYVFKGVQ